MKRLLLLIIALALALPLAACRDSEDEVEGDGFIDPTPAPGNEGAGDVALLTVAVASTADTPTPELDAAIEAFVAENPRTTVVITNYYDAAASDMDAALELLISDIKGQRAPDMIYLPSFLTNKLSREGYLTNLYSFIDGDLELSRSSFPQGLLSACEISGGLYSFGPLFYIITAEGPRDVLGDVNIITYEKLRAAMGDVRSGISMLPPGITRDKFMTLAFSVSGNAFLNRSTMIGDFDSDMYTRILEFASRLPGDASGPDDSLLSVREVKSFSWASDSDIFTGLPVPDGMNSSSAAVFATCELGILKASKNPDASWSLMRRLLQEQFQLEISRERFAEGASYLPTNLAALSRMADDTLSPKGAFFVEGQTADRAGADRIIELVRGLGNVYRDARGDEFGGSAFELIILREARAYFTGEKSAPEAARDTEEAIRKYVVSGKLEEDEA